MSRRPAKVVSNNVHSSVTTTVYIVVHYRVHCYTLLCVQPCTKQCITVYLGRVHTDVKVRRAHVRILAGERIFDQRATADLRA